jgi:hypothetical protein
METGKWKLETRKWKLETVRRCPRSFGHSHFPVFIFEFLLSTFHFPVSIFPFLFSNFDSPVNSREGRNEGNSRS